ncbi:hypothetical protein [Helicobacter cinaedi]|uniref:hypothetical protein n=1 Tax=Helicobacter cinaedi TaxID=213 RepID=UPI000D7C62C6|nr:hypothetical protein [Helicobacter cinaedi]
MSYFTDVKAKVKNMAEEAMRKNDNVWQYIHNVCGLDIYIDIQDDKYYDVVLCEVNYSTLEIDKRDVVAICPGEQLERFEYSDLDSMVEKVASLISANKFL